MAGAQTPAARLVLQPGSSIATLAGTGADGHSFPGLATASALGSPRGLAYDSAGNLYVADSANHQVNRIAPDGALTIVAGSGRQGFSGDGGAATTAELNSPAAVAFDSIGNLYIADTGNHRIRRIAIDGTISTVAGTGTPGFGGDTGPATIALLRSPQGLAFDPSGNLYIADTGNHRIRELTTLGRITTVAGSGTEGNDGDGDSALKATFESPVGLTVLTDGTLLIADRGARHLRALNTDGTVSAYNSPATRRPEGITSAAGSVYVADTGSQQVTQISADGSGGIAGTGEQGQSTAGPPLTTPLDSPSAAAVDMRDGSIAISDRRNHQVQRISLAQLNFGSVPAGDTSAMQTVSLQNGGTSALTVSSITVPAPFSLSKPGSTCGTAPFVLQPSASCTLAVSFIPTAQGQQSGTVQVRVMGAPPQAVMLAGTATAAASLAASQTALMSNGSISYAGSPVSFTATVAGTLVRQPTGNVTFTDGSWSTVVPLAAGTAELSTASLQQGAHTVRAVYSGDAAYSESTSASLTQTVIAAPDFTISTTAASYSGKAGGTVAVPLTLLPVNGTLDRAVQLTVTGLPTGSTSTFSPAALVLSGNSTPINLTIQLPSTLALDRAPRDLRFIALGCLLFLAAGVRGRRSYALFCATCAIAAVSGCGGGFSGGSSQNAGSTATTHSYSAVVTATTQGVTGDTLVHSQTFTLVVTP